VKNVERYPWGGEPDPRYPIATWFAQEVLLGDGSGGTNVINLQLAFAGPDVLDANLFSLEQMDAFSNAAGAINGEVHSTNLADVGVRFGVIINDSDAALATAAMRPSVVPRLSRFLGHMGAPGLLTAIRLITPNTNGVQMTFEALGYIWGSRSRSVPGGPKYPPGALLRA